MQFVPHCPLRQTHAYWLSTLPQREPGMVCSQTAATSPSTESICPSQSLSIPSQSSGLGWQTHSTELLLLVQTIPVAHGAFEPHGPPQTFSLWLTKHSLAAQSAAVTQALPSGARVARPQTVPRHANPTSHFRSLQQRSP